MPYAPDITIGCARPERYNAAARRARATVAGRGSPPAVMPPPRATMTPAFTPGTSPMLLENAPPSPAAAGGSLSHAAQHGHVVGDGEPA